MCCFSCLRKKTSSCISSTSVVTVKPGVHLIHLMWLRTLIVCGDLPNIKCNIVGILFSSLFFWWFMSSCIQVLLLSGIIILPLGAAKSELWYFTHNSSMFIQNISLQCVNKNGPSCRPPQGTESVPFLRFPSLFTTHLSLWVTAPSKTVLYVICS